MNRRFTAGIGLVATGMALNGTAPADRQDVRLTAAVPEMASAEFVGPRRGFIRRRAG
jgi:hypothetical protein